VERDNAECLVVVVVVVATSARVASRRLVLFLGAGSRRRGRRRASRAVVVVVVVRGEVDRRDEGGSRSGAGGRSTFAVSVARSSAPPSEALFVLWFWFPSAVSTRAVVARALDAAPWTSDLTRGDISTPGPRRSAWQARERASRASVCRGSRGAFFKQEGGLAAAKRRRKGRLPLRTQIAIR
jgi:hypothetical protein